MARAHISTKDGTNITIEGTSQEVALMTAKLAGRAVLSSPQGKHVAAKHRSRPKATPINLISELIDGGFFKKPKELSSIKVALEEQGHYYPVTTLSPVLLRLVRRRFLRRIKDKKRWLYVN